MAAQLWQEIDDVRPTQGLTMSALLDLPGRLRAFLVWMVRRQRVPLGDVCNYLDQGPEACRQLLRALQEKGLVQAIRREEELGYQVWLVVERKRSKLPDLWGALEE